NRWRVRISNERWSYVGAWTVVGVSGDSSCLARSHRSRLDLHSWRSGRHARVCVYSRFGVSVGFSEVREMKSRAMNWGMGALLLACWSILAVGCKPACARGDEAACLQLLEYVKSDEDGKREESVEKLAEACLENSEP